MNHPLFDEIELFDTWAEQISPVPQDERGGEWECDYENWNRIYEAFTKFLELSDPVKWTKEVKNKLLYIIARDNESEILADILANSEAGLVTLAQHAIHSDLFDAKWQLAVRLSDLKDKQMANQLLEVFVNDPHEYVNRRALIQLAKNQSEKTEYYCERAWNRNIYGEMDEYQRISVLHALREINSNLLETYLFLAKKDGSQYLVQNAEQIESEMKNSS